MAFASEDVADIYRRTFLGPAWSVLSFLLFVGSIVLIIGETSGIPHYMAFVSSGLIVYLTMTEVLAESSNLFQREMAFIKGTTLPISIYIMRLTSKTVIRSVYPLLAALFLVLVDGVMPTAAWFYSFLGILLIIISIPAAATVVSILGVIIPDMHFIVRTSCAWPSSSRQSSGIMQETASACFSSIGTRSRTSSRLCAAQC